MPTHPILWLHRAGLTEKRVQGAGGRGQGAGAAAEQGPTSLGAVHSIALLHALPNVPLFASHPRRLETRRCMWGRDRVGIAEHCGWDCTGRLQAGHSFA